MILETMVGFEVAPEIPQARFFWISSGSTPSSQTFVPVAISDAKDIGNSCCQFRLCHSPTVVVLCLGAQRCIGSDRNAIGPVASLTHLLRLRIVPAALGRQDAIDFEWPPGVGLILGERR